MVAIVTPTEAGAKTAITTVTAGTASDSPEKGQTRKIKPQKNCDEQKKEIKVTNKGGQLWACYQGPTGKATEEDRSKIRGWIQEKNAARPATILPLPVWCAEHVDDGYWQNRFEQCSTTTGMSVYIIDVNTHSAVGYIFFTEVNYVYTNKNSSHVIFQQSIFVEETWGLTAGTLVQGVGLPEEEIEVVSNLYPPTPLGPIGGDGAHGEIFLGGSAATTMPQGEGRGFPTINYWFTNPRWVGPSNTLTAEALPVRCDNSLPGSSTPGCVNEGYDPRMEYSLTGPWPELAQHIKDAQNDGLPGALDYEPLHRLVNETYQENNRRRACPDTLPRPTGKSCDEYPMASTHEGAWTYLEWYKVDHFSRRMIDATQNSLGGSALGAFYNNYRVIDDDPFYMNITP
ncbi:hypothetical protein GCM10022226_79200 [Sphaerisporangium flaviroseum]|uniref:Deoxyribonuclease NucA/NucB domain-containing protein n=1 Tax=Sphaerisporangium flaviroseum TaxID=509199 RepID=A0ABP7JI97_9ACTN